MKQMLRRLAWSASLRVMGSRMGLRLASRYWLYHQKARLLTWVSRRTIPGDEVRSRTAAQFKAYGFSFLHSADLENLAADARAELARLNREMNPIWSSDGLFLPDPWLSIPSLRSVYRDHIRPVVQAIYGTDSKIFYARLYKSVRQSEEPEGSQLWHSDGGPGSCINVMFCLTHVNAANGGMEVVDWTDAISIFEEEHRLEVNRGADGLDRAARRKRRTDFYEKEIARRGILPTGSESPPGLITFFRNNTLHRGGFPDVGHERIAIVFHVYPAAHPVDVDKYLEFGLPKKAAYPENPAFADEELKRC